MQTGSRRGADAAEDLRNGLAAYVAGRFRDAHESWERAWRRTEGADRRRVQGLIMLAAAAWHAGRGRGGPARRLLLRATDLLAGNPGELAIPLPPGLAALAAAAAAEPDLPVPPVSLG
ncbi:MAG: DUF309 domain-containing protein [Thermoanaerobaculaceae bacterium]|nr:DUF309 domain-containing protein [Thermoanaerobaculaceae bacterium]